MPAASMTTCVSRQLTESSGLTRSHLVISHGPDPAYKAARPPPAMQASLRQRPSRISHKHTSLLGKPTSHRPFRGFQTTAQYPTTTKPSPATEVLSPSNMAARTRPQTARPHLHVPPNHVRQAQHLPWPATTLVIAQHFFRSHSGRYWAWLIRGTFYDVRDKALWSSEVFLAMNPEDSDEGEEDDGSEGQYVYGRESFSGSESGSGTDGPDTDSGHGSSWLSDGERPRGRTGRAGYRGTSQGELPDTLACPAPFHLCLRPRARRESAPSSTDSRLAFCRVYKRGLPQRPLLAVYSPLNLSRCIQLSVS